MTEQIAKMWANILGMEASHNEEEDTWVVLIPRCAGEPLETPLECFRLAVRDAVREALEASKP